MTVKNKSFSEDFIKLPLMGIVRGISGAELRNILKVSVEAGLKSLEIALNTPDALGLIKTAAKKYSGKIHIGAGTVLSVIDAIRAIDNGAEFIVMPVTDFGVCDFLESKSVPFFPGALTPTEIKAAYDAGAFMVKVFPAGGFGPAYIRQVKQPLNDVKLLVTGGVNEKNAGEYIKNGADGIAFGASIYNPKDLRLDPDIIKEKIRALIRTVSSQYHK